MAECLIPVGMDFTYTGITNSYQEILTSVGLRISLPCKWKWNPCSPWDVSFEPFFLIPTLGGEQLFYGVTGGLVRLF